MLRRNVQMPSLKKGQLPSQKQLKIIMTPPHTNN